MHGTIKYSISDARFVGRFYNYHNDAPAVYNFSRSPQDLLGSRLGMNRGGAFGADDFEIRAVFAFVQAVDQLLNLPLIDKSHS